MNLTTDDVNALAIKADEQELSYDDPVGEYLRGLVSERDQLLKAIHTIASMTDPEDMEVDKEGLTEWGCTQPEAVEMSYENAITIAQLALGEAYLP